MHQAHELVGMTAAAEGESENPCKFALFFLGRFLLDPSLSPRANPNPSQLHP